jgi:hypothetical protein
LGIAGRSRVQYLLAGLIIMPVLHIGLASWIIQDGNHEDFAAGGSYLFALEFYPLDIAPFTPIHGGVVLSLHHTIGATHEARGKVVRAAPSSWVVDFGVPAFHNSEPPGWARPGVLVRGEVYLGVDPFFYLEELRDEPGMHNLLRDWLVRRILLETTPWQTSTDAGGQTVITRADVPRSFVEVRRTDAWNDDDGHAHYVLESELQAAG